MSTSRRLGYRSGMIGLGIEFRWVRKQIQSRIRYEIQSGRAITSAGTSQVSNSVGPGFKFSRAESDLVLNSAFRAGSDGQ